MSGTEIGFSVTADTMTRPADTTQYTAGDLVANSTTGSSVTPLSWDLEMRGPYYGLVITGARLVRSDETDTTSDDFRLHLFNTSPTIGTNGDNSAFLSEVDSTGWIGSITLDDDVQVFADAVAHVGTPDRDNNLIYYGSDKDSPIFTLYGLLEALGTYTPASAETFIVTLEGTIPVYGGAA